jgi:alpha,alpha-trehalase
MNRENSIRTVREHIRERWDQTVVSTRNEPGVVPLPHPFTVPTIGPTFRSFFYWDTYFTCLGLLRQDRVDLAVGNARNFIHLCRTLGFIPNFNLEGHLNRSQLPVAALLYAEIWQTTGDREILADAYDALGIEYAYWMGLRSGPHGLNRHSTHATPVEVDAFYGVVKDRFAKIPTDRAERRRFLFDAIAEAENWDFTPRYDRRCSDFYAVDLNALLLSMEEIAQDFATELGVTEDAVQWSERAAKRRALMREFLWNPEKGLFFDYDLARGCQGSVISAANYFALACGVPTAGEAALMLAPLAASLELEYGLSTCAARESMGEQVYQWDYPNAWPPIQAMGMIGMQRYGFAAEAKRLAEKYVSTVVRNFESSGQLWEKYNACTGGIDVADEYAMPPMMGWTAGIFLFACDLLEGGKTP